MTTSQSQPAAATTPGWRRILAPLSDLPTTTIVSLLGLVGGLLYLVLRTSDAIFYNSFSVAPEEVGLGPADTGVRSALALIIGLVPGALAIATISLAQWRTGRRLETSLTNVGLTLNQLIDLVWLEPAKREDYLMRLNVPSEKRPTLLTQAAVLDKGVFGNPILRRTTLPLMRLQVAMYDTKRILRFAIGYALALVIAALFLLNALAVGSAESVKAGFDGRVAIGDFQLLPWGADRVDVSAKPDIGRTFDPHECFVYLGQAGGTAILYAVNAQETIRVPSTSIVLTTRLNRRTCR